MQGPGENSVGKAPSANEAGAIRSLSLADKVKSLRLSDRTQRGGGGGGSGPLSFVLLILVVVLMGGVAYNAYATYTTRQRLEEIKKAMPTTPVDPDDPLAGLGDPVDPKVPSRPVGDIALESKGYILPVSTVQVSPKVGGTVVELNFTEGMKIDKGFLLAKIETTEYQSDFDRAEASVQAATRRLQELEKFRDEESQQLKAELDDAKVQRTQLYKEYLRSQSLRYANALAAKEFEEAESRYKSQDFRVRRLELGYKLLKEEGPRDAQIGAAKAQIAQAQAELDKAKWRLDNCTVRAPIGGTILSKRAEQWNQVNPAAFSNGLSASLCEMADLADLEVDLAIAERDIAKVRPGQKCMVRAEAFPDRLYNGTVSRIMPAADRAKGAVPVRVKIDIPQEEAGMFLRPEMGAIVTFWNKK